MRRFWVTSAAQAISAAALILVTSAAQAATTSYAGRTFQIDNAGRSYNFRNNGDGSVRFEVRKGDVFGNSNYQDPPTSERTELGDVNYDAINRAYRIDFQLLFEPGLAITSRWVCLLQLKGAPSENGSPPFELAIRSGKLVVIRRDDAGEYVLWTDSAAVKRNHAYQVRIEAAFDPTGGTGGYARVWLDGVQIVNHSGRMGRRNQQGTRVRFGIYRYTAPETVAVAFRNMTIQTGAKGTVFPNPPSVPGPSPTPTPVPTATAVQLSNPGFESGLTAWENWGNSVVTSQSQSGNYAVAIGTGEGGIGQNILSRLIPGRTYRLSMYARIGSTTDLGGRVGISFQNGSNPNQNKTQAVRSNLYQRYVIDFVAPASGTVTAVKIFAWKDSGPSTLFVDGVSLHLL